MFSMIFMPVSSIHLHVARTRLWRVPYVGEGSGRTLRDRVRDGRSERS